MRLQLCSKTSRTNIDADQSSDITEALNALQRQASVAIKLFQIKVSLPYPLPKAQTATAEEKIQIKSARSEERKLKRELALHHHTISRHYELCKAIDLIASKLRTPIPNLTVKMVVDEFNNEPSTTSLAI